MAGKKNTKGGDPEGVPAAQETFVSAYKNPVEKTSAATDQQEQEVSADETVEEPGVDEAPADAAVPGVKLQTQEIPSDESRPAEEADIFSDEVQLEESLPEEEIRDLLEEDPVQEKLYRITCRNRISETIGGVMFVAGVGYTRNAYSASWFANKDGYSVSEE